jgi:hypothetical protein
VSQSVCFLTLDVQAHGKSSPRYKGCVTIASPMLDPRGGHP